MATSRRVGNYSTSAKAVIRNSDAIFDAAMSGKPDFTKISKEAIKGRSLERRAATKAEADVASAGLKAFTDTNLTRMREDTFDSYKKESLRVNFFIYKKTKTRAKILENRKISVQMKIWKFKNFIFEFFNFF